MVEPIKPVELKGSVLTIQVPSQFFYEWLEEHYVSLLRKTIKRELSNDARLEYRIVVENSSTEIPLLRLITRTITQETRPIRKWGFLFFNGHHIKNPFIIPGLKKINIDSQLNANYNFDSFVEGDCNRLARSAGYAVAQKPGGTAFNPLVVYGGVGLGKRIWRKL